MKKGGEPEEEEESSDESEGEEGGVSKPQARGDEDLNFNVQRIEAIIAKYKETGIQAYMWMRSSYRKRK